MSQNKRQIGGDHYKTSFEHWDLVEESGMGYLEGNASKYVARWRKKNGKQDLEKALHYVEKLVELYDSIGRRNRCMFLLPQSKIADFVRINGLGMEELVVLMYLCNWHTKEDLILCAGEIKRMINGRD